MIRPICRDQAILATPSRPAVKKDLHLARDLEDTLMAHDNCVGMAADMIGENVRILVARLAGMPVVMFDPEILSKKQPYETEEGCLCHFGMRPATRYEVIEVRYRDRKWKLQTRRLQGLAAQIIQHEMDHFEGILI